MYHGFHFTWELLNLQRIRVEEINKVYARFTSTKNRRALTLRFFVHSLNFTRCKRNAFSTTDTELNAIAAPATQGASNPAAAIGIPIEL